MKNKRPYLFPVTAKLSIEDSLSGTSFEQALKNYFSLCPASEIPESNFRGNFSHSPVTFTEKQLQHDACHLEFTSAEICGIPALFTRYRIDMDTVPHGLFRYEIRGNEDFLSEVEIAQDILNNFIGTLLVAECLLADHRTKRHLLPEELDISGRQESLSEWRYQYGY